MRIQSGIRWSVIVLAGCTSMGAHDFRVPESEAATQAAERYRACVYAATDQLSSLPVSAEEMVSTAEGQCRSAYVTYADTLRSHYASYAQSGAEKQLANDRADAQLREAQRNLRQVAIERIGLQSLTRNR